MEKPVNLYSYKQDEARTEIPEGHLRIINPEKQRKDCLDYFENNVDLWIKYYEKDEGHPYKHNLDLSKSILQKYLGKKKTLLDLGCGAGVPLIEFLKMGFDASGCDFAPSAITITNDNLKKSGYNNAQVFKADIEDESTLPDKKYDIIVSVGVFPHLTDDLKCMQNIRKMLNEDGVIVLHFRNDLFNAFALNAYSKDFYKNLIDFNTLPEQYKDKVSEFYNKTLGTAGVNSEFKILSRFHNPLSIQKELFEPLGFEIVKIHFFHYHRLPPYFQLEDNKTYMKLGEALEKTQDWRGYFMASSFIVEGVRK